MNEILQNTKCRFFEQCGGCDYLDLSDESYQTLKQNEFKKILQNKFVIDSLSIDYIWITRDRRKIILQVDNKNNLGFFSKKTNDLVKIDSCHIANDIISNIIPKLIDFISHLEQGLVSQIILTAFDSGLDVVFNVKKEPNLSGLNKFTNLAITNKINVSYQKGKDLRAASLHHKNQIFYNNFKIDLASEIFIQATKSGLAAIFNFINEVITKYQSKNIVDLYAGFGAYGFNILDHFPQTKITAFEGEQKMVDLMKINANKNNFNAKLQPILRDLFNNKVNAKELDKFDLAILNPPRNGALPQVQEIAKSKIKNIIYVSCNPLTFARDSEILVSNGFKFERITMLDQFYGTKHCEVIALLTKF